MCLIRWKLIHELEAQFKDAAVPLLNAVIYCSVLKGFTREKNMPMVWEVYETMKKRSIEFSIVTYNTLLDACARCSCNDQLQIVLEHMQRERIRPNVITYSTMLKGYCQAGDVDMALSTKKYKKKWTLYCSVREIVLCANRDYNQLFLSIEP